MTPPRTPRLTCSLTALLVTLVPAGVTQAQGQGNTPAPHPTPPVSTSATPPTQRVEVQGGADAQETRRRSTASRIIYGRDEIERMGDSTVGELLKRLPGVTVSGRPGRGGEPRMRGLGNGYTQILVDGERMPPGFSVDAIEPDQIERIEILRAPVAEFGARAIAGTINIVLREAFQPRQHTVRLGVQTENGRPRGNAAWTGGDRKVWSAQESLDATGTATLSFRQQRDTAVTTLQSTDATGGALLQQRIANTAEPENLQAGLSGRLRYQSGRTRWEIQPSLNLTRSEGSTRSELTQTLGSSAPPYASAQGQSSSGSEQGRLAGTWQHTDTDGGRWQLRVSSGWAHSHSEAESLQQDAAGTRLRLRQDTSDIRDQSLTTSGKWSRLMGADHSLVSGAEWQFNRRLDARTLLDNGTSRLAEFGENVEARSQRVAFYAQDEWDWTRQWGLHAGLRWEAIETEGRSALQGVSNRSALLTPLAHLVYRIPGSRRDQVRLSLTRSYRAPSTAQLIARPVLSGLYPVDGANTATSPDRAGNPNLRPEVATGLDLAVERYLPAGGLFSANLFVRDIQDLIRSVRSLQSVSWSPAQRWVSRPQNIGSAQTAGIELEARFRAVDAGLPDWPLTVRSNASRFWSRVDQVPGPNNRLDQQPTWTANLGLDWAGRIGGWSFGGNLNLTPGFVVQQFDAQVYEQGRKRVFDAYALWRWTAHTQVRSSVSNAFPLDYRTGTTVTLDDGSRQQSQTLAATRTALAVRLEHRF